MKKTVLLTIVVMFCALPAYGEYPITGATQDAYCQIPPYLASSARPNINMVLDFSGSMQYPAYVDCPSDRLPWAPVDPSGVYDCGSSSPPTSIPFNYNAARNYYGNFKSNLFYRYDATNRYFVENAGCQKQGTLASGCVPGNMLNWISTTRVDVLRKILTGGRVAATPDVIGNEGSRYIVTDTGLRCVFTVTAGTTTTRTLDVANLGAGPCEIGTATGFSLNVQTTTPATDITGVIQSIYPSQVDLELINYNRTIRVNFRTGKNMPVQNYLDAINTELPTGGTPTGEALLEAQYYFQQSNLLSAAGRANVLGIQNSQMDPYYDPLVAGANSNPGIPVKCRNSNVLLISDGEWNGTGRTALDPVNPAYTMHTTDMRPDSNLPGSQNVTTYAVYAFGTSAQGRNAMITTAMFGGFNYTGTSPGFPYPFNALPRNSLRVPSYPLQECNPNGTYDSRCTAWDTNNSGLPYNYFEANNGALLKQAITNAVNSILVTRPSSGTSASMLGNSDSSGAVMLQALFYKDKQFSRTSTTEWLGDIQAYWYYIDPGLNSAKMTLREDTVSDKKLNLAEDKVVRIVNNGTETKARIYENNGTFNDRGLDEVRTLWNAGKLLFSRSPGSRTVYTSTPTNKMISFSTSNRSFIQPYLDVAGNVLPATDDLDATNVINYTLGMDFNTSLLPGERSATLNGYRNRTGTISLLGTHAWKLGDIINSTPRMISASALQTHNATSPTGYSDKAYDKFISSVDYQNRGVVFAGGNDGMLHAFKLGKVIPGKKPFVSRLVNSTGLHYSDPVLPPTDLGIELWSYIPRNALPYLKHLGHPRYGHLYYVDQTPVIADVSIAKAAGVCSNDSLRGCSSSKDCNSKTATCDPLPGCSGPDCLKLSTSWKTVLIGSMGLGGATRNQGVQCNTTTSNTATGNVPVANCVNTPIAGVGYSSYFAMDVTDPASPKLLWEFSDPGLGYSTVGPAIVRIRDDNDKARLSEKNGHHFVVLASGPTGPIFGNQFMGLSDQSLNIYVLDLSTGQPKHTFSNSATKLIDGVPHTLVAAMPSFAFGGSLSGATIDTDRVNIGRPGNYSDDAIYLGYTRQDTTTGSPSFNKFAKGGVLRILTGNTPLPSKWTISTVIDGIGPVTSAIAKLQNPDDQKLWLYFGTGRYYYKFGTNVDEDYTGQREALYGLIEPCYTQTDDTLNSTCTTKISSSNLQNQKDSIQSLSGKDGWYINLDLESGSSKAKRTYTTPTGTSNGAVFFTTFMPSSEVCGSGGSTSLWAVDYSTGGSLSSRNLKGQVILQLSTGELAQIDLQSAFVNNLGRESNAYVGVPPGPEPPKFVDNANHSPSKKVLHIMER